MAVRFLPPPEERRPANRDEGENLAEVVEMRSWLRPAHADDAAEAEEPDSAAWRPAALADEVAIPEDSGVAPVTRVRFGGTAAGPTESILSPAEQPAVEQPATEQPSVEQPASARATRKPSADRGRGRSVAAAQPDDSESDRSEAYEDAVRLLARRARSSGELRADLLALDHSADAVMIVIDEFIESHYLDDMGLARVQSEKLRDSKGASRGQIKRKLRERKLPDEVIEEILGELDTGEEFELLREAAHKRAKSLNGLDRETAKRRLLGFLARRGWSGEPAMRAVNEALDGTGRQERGRGSGGVRFE